MLGNRAPVDFVSVSREDTAYSTINRPMIGGMVGSRRTLIAMCNLKPQGKPLPSITAGRDVRRAVSLGRRLQGSFCILRVLRHSPGAFETCRFAYIASKRQGGSVERNRMKRRLREAVRTAASPSGSAFGDVAVICRKEALTAPWSELCGEVARLLRRAGVVGGANQCD